ncbi:effector-associated domain EAD1-containing protein [Asanoa sp. NPDC049573]|uniref:KGGVGR-motif variant AAA ATPase n=1 Tax=Asanoa sp. NPDC049573 TaxID=3155396 RepID=UPI00343111C0
MIVTFYSYKGGTGRTMALANIAVLLANAGHRVLMVDFDLEAPGIWRYFSDLQTGLDRQEGLLDLLNAHADGHRVDWRSYTTKIRIGVQSVSLMTSGRQDADYPGRVLDFDWSAFFAQHGGGEFFERLRDEWLAEYDFVLIDSRTGITDIGGICTIALPDMIVPVFVANNQNIDGVVEVLRRAQKGRQDLAYDRAPALVLPVLSRFDSRTEYEFVNEWLTNAANRFGEFYADWLPAQVNPRVVLERTKLPYVAYFGFGEKLAVLLQGISDPDSLGYAVNSIATLIRSRLADLSPVVPQPIGSAAVTGSARSLAPAVDTWIAAVHLDEMLLGTAVLIDRRLLLTAAHLVAAHNANDLSVSFPKADDERRYAVADVALPDDIESHDFVLITLAEPAPPSASPARLDFSAPNDLVGQRWWAFGFPRDNKFGRAVHGTVAASLTYGLLQLESQSRPGLEGGFSGAAVWSPDQQAVVGLVVGKTGEGDGLALTLHRIDASAKQDIRRLRNLVVDSAQLGSRQRRDLVTALARAFGTWDRASELLQLLGFPARQRPSRGEYASPELLWERIITDVENGAVEGGVGQLVAEALKIYPHNPVLTEIAATLQP